jgi:hypothetical protein
VAVEWWKEKLRRPKFQTLPRSGRRSEEDKPAAFAEAMAVMAHSPVSEEQIGSFGEALALLLENTQDPYLGVDYHPCLELAEALERAGIESGITTLPWKTSMWFRDGGVSAKCGYGEPAEELLPSTRSA